jgi:hypothetical protein
VLQDNLHLAKFNLRYVPHSLEADQKPSRVELFRKLLPILEQDQQDMFERLLTGDECWFFSEYFHHSCWAANPDDVPEIPKQNINPKRALFRLFGVTQGPKVCYMFRTA